MEKKQVSQTLPELIRAVESESLKAVIAFIRSTIVVDNYTKISDALERRQKGLSLNLIDVSVRKSLAHRTIPELVQQVGAESLEAVVTFLRSTLIPANHMAIISALERRRVEMADDELCDAAIVSVGMQRLNPKASAN